MRKPLTLLSCLLVVVSIFPARANDALTPLRVNTPPVIDGKLDDLAWQQAPSVTGFKTFVPDFGLEMPDQTVVYYAYDHENLYFAFRCFDREPHKIKTSVTKRDNIRPDDWICINLDSFNDQQALYGFYVNPAGIQEDTRFANGSEDAGIDLIWHSAGAIDSAGYTIEVQIPFKSIRFANRAQVEMGVVFERRVSRRAEQGTFPPLKPERGMFFLTQMHPMVIHDVKNYRLFELLPGVTHSQRSSRADGRLVSEGDENEFSVTTKYGLTSELILDGTYNPDFSQVEADAGQVDRNLRFALFYPEKRPFFLEGDENYNFAGGNGNDPLLEVAHTRTIVNPIAGIKLSGKIGKKNFLALIDALDDLPAGSEGKHAHASLLRYKRALRGDSFIGAFYTGREEKNGHNRVAGPDGQMRINESSILGYHLFLSQYKAGAALPVQDGHALGLDYLYNTRNLDVNLGVQDLSDDFTTVSGFLTRTGISRARATVTPKFYPKSGFIRRIDVSLTSAQVKDKPSDLFETDNIFTLRFIPRRNANIAINANYSTEVFAGKRFQTSGWTLGASSQLTKQVFLRLAYGGGKGIYYEAATQAKRSDALMNLIYQPSDKLNANLTLTYADLFDESSSRQIFDGAISRLRLTYQVNRYLFFRGIVENNTLRRRLLTDFLASFTYIPGTVLHLGYGSLYEKDLESNPRDRYLETQRGFFSKASYLWRL